MLHTLSAGHPSHEEGDLLRCALCDAALCWWSIEGEWCVQPLTLNRLLHNIQNRIPSPHSLPPGGSKGSAPFQSSQFRKGLVTVDVGSHIKIKIKRAFTFEIEQRILDRLNINRSLLFKISVDFECCPLNWLKWSGISPQPCPPPPTHIIMRENKPQMFHCHETSCK